MTTHRDVLHYVGLSFTLTDRRFLTGGTTDLSRERFSNLRKARNLGLKHVACQCIFYVIYQLLNAVGFNAEEFFYIFFFQGLEHS